ncbi:unnamed protein product [Lampetra planeri]
MFSTLQAFVLGDKTGEKKSGSVISETEYMDLKKQVEDLKGELQRAEEQVRVQEEPKVKVSANLELDVNEKTLSNQVKFLTIEVHRERAHRKLQSANVRKERARLDDERCQRIQLGQELEEARKQKDDLKQLLVTREDEYQAQIHRVTCERDNIQEQMIQNTQIMTQCLYNKEQLFLRELVALTFRLNMQMKANIQLTEAILKEKRSAFLLRWRQRQGRFQKV